LEGRKLTLRDLHLLEELYVRLSAFRLLSVVCLSSVVYTSTIRYDTIEEINVDSKAEYTA